MRVTVREEALREEAAGVVRQAVWLARSRGHAQVTPLHMASAMLSPSAAGVLRAACVRSQSHLLQLNALDLRVDVTLDSLSCTAIHVPRGHDGGWHVGPVPSNAFVAALKRALAHGQRRRYVDGGKVGLEQLAVSVLDDPAVDRVVRAAGFSSSQLRAAISSEESSRANCGITTSPGRVPDVASGSESQASQPKSGTTRLGFFDGTELAGTTAIRPPWLRHYQDIIPTGATICGTNILPVDAVCHRAKFTELTAQNMKILCDALELRCPRHADIVPGISSTLLWCRSGLGTRRTMPLRKQQPTSSSSPSTTTWLLFRGRDAGGKTAIALELAKLVFGSYANFIALQAGNSDKPIRTTKITLKRQRAPGDGCAGPRLLLEAIRENPHRVILIDGVDRLDRDSEMRIRDAIVAGKVSGCNGDAIGLEDAIVVLCSDELDSAGSMVSSPPVIKPRIKTRVQDREEGNAMGKEVRSSRRRLSLDLNVCAEDGEEEDSISAEDSAILDVVDGVFLFN